MARDEDVEQEDHEHRGHAPGQAEEQAPVERRDRIDQLERDRARERRGCQHGRQQPAARARLHRPALLDAEAPAQPGRDVGDDVDGAHPRAVRAPADQQIDGQDDHRAGQRRGRRQVAGNEALQHHERIGERHHAEREAGRQGALDDPHAEPGSGREQQEDAELRDASRDQPAMRDPPAVALDGRDAGDAVDAHRPLPGGRPEPGDGAVPGGPPVTGAAPGAPGMRSGRSMTPGTSSRPAFSFSRQPSW